MEKRETYGIMSGVVGIVVNLILFGIKLLAGTLSGSISIISDALNNLSDGGSSIITLVGFKLAGQKPDAEHPYGHGRMEYLSGLAISVTILAMGLDLLKESVGKILHPSEVISSPLVLGILAVSIGAKIFLAMFNFKLGKEINSATILATAKDSLSDCIATGTVLVSMGINARLGLNLDGYCGCFVALFVLYAGYSSLKESVNPLLGMPPEKEFVDKLEEIVMNFDENIVGMHDLMVHDYGPGRCIISLHAEVPSDGDIMMLHDLIDQLEKKINEELSCVTTIHLDPIAINDPMVMELREQVSQIAKEIHEDISVHDFRVVWGNTHTNLIFDMAVSFACKDSNEEIIARTRKLVKDQIDEKYLCVIEIDRENHIYKL